MVFLVVAFLCSQFATDDLLLFRGMTANLLISVVLSIISVCQEAHFIGITMIVISSFCLLVHIKMVLFIDLYKQFFDIDDMET